MLHPNQRQTARSLLQWKGKHYTLKAHCTEVPAHKNIWVFRLSTAQLQFCNQTTKGFKTSLAPDLSGNWKSYRFLLCRAWDDVTLFKESHSNKMKRFLIQAWDVTEGNETRSLNTAGDASPNQTGNARTASEKKKWNCLQAWCWNIRKYCKSADTSKRLFSPPLLSQVELYQQAGARKQAHGEELENVPSEMLFRKMPAQPLQNTPSLNKYFWLKPTPTFCIYSIVYMYISLFRWKRLPYSKLDAKSH